ncbi:MAG: glutamyl-tRNA reductase [Rhodospirillales bacterium]|nr:glutamyl-tRNA reductase [Rhodospirillales bacterium]
MHPASKAAACLVMVGANHRTSALAMRDRLFVDAEAMPTVLGRLRERGIPQAIVVSTCDRVEVSAIHEDPDLAAERIAAVLADHAGLTPSDVGPHLRTLVGEAALRHLLRVAASLDSMVVGEPHVLGELKACHRVSQAHGMTGPELEAVLQVAYAAAKRVRNETGIVRRPVSIAAAAASLAEDVHGDLRDRTALMIGTGDLGTLIAETMVTAGLRHLFVTHPVSTRAEAAAAAFNCHVIAFADLSRELARADIVIGALGTRRYVITETMIKASLSARRRRPMVLIDAAIPGDADPGIDRLDDAFLFALDDLERVALRGHSHRQSAAPAAEAIIDAAVTEYARTRAGRQAVPVVRALHEHFEAVRRQAVADAAGDADKATRLLVGRLLHEPSEQLRAVAADCGDDTGRFRALQQALVRLFGLHGRNGENRE